MRTICSGHLGVEGRGLPRSVYLEGRVSAWGRYLPKGVSLGGCLPRGIRGSLPRGMPSGVCLGGVCPGVSAKGVYTTPPVDKILDTRLWKHYPSPTTVADGKY